MTSAGNQPYFSCASQSTHITAPSVVGYILTHASMRCCSSLVQTRSSSGTLRSGSSVGR